jgi:hypothetical protein
VIAASRELGAGSLIKNGLSHSLLDAAGSMLVKLRRPFRRGELPASGFVDLAEETDKAPFAVVLANYT